MPAPPGPGWSPPHSSVHGAPLPTVLLKPIPAGRAGDPRAEPAKPSAPGAAAARCLHRSQDNPGLPPLPPGAAARHVGLQDQGTGDKRVTAGRRSGLWSEGLTEDLLPSWGPWRPRGRSCSPTCPTWAVFSLLPRRTGGSCGPDCVPCWPQSQVLLRPTASFLLGPGWARTPGSWVPSGGWSLYSLVVLAQVPFLPTLAQPGIRGNGGCWAAATEAPERS